MEEKEDIGPDMLDSIIIDDFYFQPDRQERGDGKNKRSSILKQTKTFNIDVCEFDEIENKRKSQGIKRVSFADTFQVKDLHTGNIYDIPGRHGLEVSKETNQESCFIEGEKENVDVLLSSSIPGISNVILPEEPQSQDVVNFKHPSGAKKITDALSKFDFGDKNLFLNRSIMTDNIQKPFAVTSQLETSTIEQSFHLSEVARTDLESSSVEKDYELTIMHKQDQLSFDPFNAESSCGKLPKGENYTLKTRHIISSTVSYGETETPLKKTEKEILEFLDKQPFEFSVKRKLSIGSGIGSPSFIENNDSFSKEILEHKAQLFSISNKNSFKDKLFSNDPRFEEMHRKSEKYFSLDKESISDFVFQPKGFSKMVESASCQEEDRKSATRPWWTDDSMKLSEGKAEEGNFMMPLSGGFKKSEAAEHLSSDPFEANIEKEYFENQQFAGGKSKYFEKTADTYSTKPSFTAKTQGNMNMTILAPSPMDMTLPVSFSDVNEDSSTENSVARFRRQEPSHLENSEDACSRKFEQNLSTSSICSLVSKSELSPSTNKTKVINDDMEITYMNLAEHCSAAEKYLEETGNKTKFTINDMEVTCVSNNDFLEESFKDDSFINSANNSGDPVAGMQVECFSSENEKAIQNELSKCVPNLGKYVRNVIFENIELKTSPICNELKSNYKISAPNPNRSAHSSLVPKAAVKKYPKDVCQDNLTSNKDSKVLSMVAENDFNPSDDMVLKDVSKQANVAQNICISKKSVLQRKQVLSDEDSHYSQIGANGTKFMKVSEKEYDKIQVLHPENVLYTQALSKDFILDKENINCNRKRNVRVNSSNLKVNALKCQEVELSPQAFKFYSSKESEIEKNLSNRQIIKPFLINEMHRSVQDGKSIFQSSVMGISCNTEYSDESSVSLEIKDLDCNSSSNKELDMNEYISGKLNSFENPKTRHFDSDGMELTCAVKSNTLHSMNNENEERHQQENFSKKSNVSDRLGLIEHTKTRHFESDVMEFTYAVRSNTLHSLNDDNEEIDKQENIFKNCSLKDRVSSVENPKTRHFESEEMEFTCAIRNSMFLSVDDDDEANQHEKSVGSQKKGKLGSVENSKAHHSEPDGMELSSAVKNNALQLIGDGIFKVNQKVKCLKSPDINRNNNLSENSIKTCNFISDKMEITCAVECNDHAQCSSSHNLELSVDLQDKSLFINDCMNQTGESANQTSNSHEMEFTDCMNDTGESVNQTFNSHEMEFTCAADRSHNLQVSPFFKVKDIFSSNSPISRREHSLGFRNKNDVERHKVIPVPFSDIPLQSEKMEQNEMSNPLNLHKSFCLVSKDRVEQALGDGSRSVALENITSDKQTIETSHKTHSSSSQNFERANRFPFKPCSLKDAKLKMSSSEFRNLQLKALTPPAVYTLRKMREHRLGNIYNEVLLSPEVKCIMKKARNFNPKQPFSEMKFQSPARIDHKKTFSFNSFSAESSFLCNPKEYVQQSRLQSRTSSLKSMNDNTGVSNLSDLALTPSSAFKNFIQSVNPCLKDMTLSEKKYSEVLVINENRGDDLTNITNDSLQILSNSITDATMSFAPETASMALSEKLRELRTLPKDASVLAPSSERNLHQLSKAFHPSTDTVKKSIHFSNSFDESVLIDEQKVPTPTNEESVSIDEQKVPTPTNDKSDTLNGTSEIAHENTGRKQKIIECLPGVDTSLQFKEVCIDSNKSVAISEEITSGVIHLNSVINKDAISMDERTTPNDMTKMESANESLHDLNARNLHRSQKIIVMHETLKPSENLPTVEECDFQKTDFLTSLGKTVTVTEMAKQHEDLSKVEILDPHKTNVMISPEKAVGDKTSKQSQKEPSQFDIPDSNNADYLFDQEKIVRRDETSKISEYLSLMEIPDLNSTSNLISLRKTVGISEVSEQLENPEIPYISDKHAIEDPVNLTFSHNEIPIKNDDTSLSASNSSSHFHENSPCKAASFSYPEPFKKTGILEMNRIPLAAKEHGEVLYTSNKPDEYEISEIHNDTSASDFGMLSSEEDLDSLRIKFKEASGGSCWKLETLDKIQAVFRLEWGVWLYRCYVMIYVDPKSPGESIISFEPCPEDDDEHEEFVCLGYKFFKHLVRDEIVPFSVCDTEMIQKLTTYSCVAKKVEALMRDIMHISVGEIFTVSEDLNPLVLSVEVLNESRVSTFLMTFHINLQTYPSERIIPEVKHLEFEDITKEVEEAIRNVEPSKNYLWNMVKLAMDF